jgi:leucyl aminopeptidase
MSISLSAGSLPKKITAAVIFVTQEEVSGSHRAAVLDLLVSYTTPSDLATVFKAMQFTGKAGQVCVHVGAGVPLVFVGLGALDKKPTENMETLRRALGTGYSQVSGLGVTGAVVSIPEEAAFGLSRAQYLEQVATVLVMASYQFIQFKKDKKSTDISLTLVDLTKRDATAVKTGVLMGEAINRARTLADTPGNHMYPEVMARVAADIAKEFNLKYTVIEQDEARDMGMGCFYSVAKGSEHAGKIVILEYAPAKGGDVPTLAFVGKGVCFDTGGISLKPSNYMTGMKYDMSGAAAVFATMQIIAQLELPVRVVGITPLVENMPSGRASKQDDVVQAMNGLFVEIDNTDAEGRLILSDAMCYVQKKYDPAVMIDIATLTGSCAMTFGPFFAGLMTRDEALSKDLVDIGFFVGDKVWPLPLTDEYKPAIESAVADISNSGSPAYKAGAITAGLFLEYFVDKGRRWAHLDIAGTDSKIPGTTYLGRGATGTGIRVLVEYARRFKK